VLLQELENIPQQGCSQLNYRLEYNCGIAASAVLRLSANGRRVPAHSIFSERVAEVRVSPKFFEIL
jgi:hypothetical protein